jgi:hypothetical protein
MFKLLIGLAITDLAFNHPLLTALTLVGVFFYQNLTDQDKQEIMSIYSNGKEFTKYLTNKAKELGITIQELRKQVAVDLEVPESESATTTNHSELETMLEEYLTTEDINIAKEYLILVEQLAKTIKEAIDVPESIWIESTLEMFLAKHDFDNEFKELIDAYLPYTSLTTNFTPKNFRQLQAKVKSLSRNNIGEIIDSDLDNTCLYFLKHLKAYFTDNYELL